MNDRAEQLQHALLSRLKMRHPVLLQSVARHGRLSRVAAELRLSQPAITKALQDIEGMFMTRLFDRTGRGLTPTPAGDIVLIHARTALSDVESTARGLASIEAGLQGRVRIGVIPHLPAALLDAVLTHSLKHTPRVAVMVREGTTDELVPALRARELDCVIGRSFNDGGDIDIEQGPLHRQAPCLLVPVKSRARLSRGALDWQRLARLDWILPPPDTPIRRTIDAFFASAGVPPSAPVVETYSLKSIDVVLRTQADAIAILAHDIGGELAAASVGAMLPYPLSWGLPPISLLSLKGATPQRLLPSIAAAIRDAATGIAVPPSATDR